jgi:hypothetical protein
MARFRLRTLFILTTIAAVLLWAFFVPPHALGLAVIHFFYCLLPAVTVAGVVFHRGHWRAFFIGVASLTAAQWFSSVPDALFGTWAVNPAGGSFGMPSGMFGPWSFTEFVVHSTTMDDGAIIQSKFVFAIPLALTFIGGLVAVGVRWWSLAVSHPSDERPSDCQE